MGTYGEGIQLRLASQTLRETEKHYDACVKKVFHVGDQVICKSGKVIFWAAVEHTDRQGTVIVRNVKTSKRRRLNVEQCITMGWRGLYTCDVAMHTWETELDAHAPTKLETEPS